MSVTKDPPRQYQILANPENKDQLIEALRYIKNSIIGNPTRKYYYLKTLAIAPRYNFFIRLVDFLADYGSDPSIMSEIAPIIGSLAQFDVVLLVQAGVLGPLFESLLNSNLKVVESSAKALRSIVQHPTTLRDCVLEESFIHNLVNLSKIPKESSMTHICEVCIRILARLAEDNSVREYLCKNGGVSILTEWLQEQWTDFPKVQESALDCLSSLCKGNTIASSVSQHEGICI
jgi:armadillo repeat-containing protein 8